MNHNCSTITLKVIYNTRRIFSYRAQTCHTARFLLTKAEGKIKKKRYIRKETCLMLCIRVLRTIRFRTVLWRNILYSNIDIENKVLIFIFILRNVMYYTTLKHIYWYIIIKITSIKHFISLHLVYNVYDCNLVFITDQYISVRKHSRYVLGRIQ